MFHKRALVVRKGKKESYLILAYDEYGIRMSGRPPPRERLALEVFTLARRASLPEYAQKRISLPRTA